MCTEPSTINSQYSHNTQRYGLLSPIVSTYEYHTVDWFVTGQATVHFYQIFHGFQGGLKAAEPYHGDIWHVRRALGGGRPRSGAVGRARDSSGGVALSRHVLIARGARRPVAGGAPARVNETW